MKKIVQIIFIFFFGLIPIGTAYSQINSYSGTYNISSFVLDGSTDLSDQVEYCTITEQTNSIYIVVFAKGQIESNDPIDRLRYLAALEKYDTSSGLYHKIDFPLEDKNTDKMTGRINKTGNRVLVEILLEGKVINKLDLLLQRRF